MGTTAATHFMDSGNGRYLSLPFTQKAPFYPTLNEFSRFKVYLRFI